LLNRIFTFYISTFKGLSRDVWYFAGMMLINRLGTLILPFLTLYTTQQLGWTKIDAGYATMCFGIGSFTGAYLGGEMTDKFGYYKTMAISLFSAAIGFYFLQYVSDLYLMCGFLFICAVLADLLRPAVMSGLTSFTTKETRTRAVSLIRLAFNLGLGIGPAIAGIMIEWYGYSVIFVIDAITCLFAGIFLILVMKDRAVKMTKDEKKKLNNPSPIKDRLFLLFMFACILQLISFFQILFTVPLFLKERLLFSESDIGIFYAFNGILIFLCEMPIIYWIENVMTKFKAMNYGTALMALAVVFLILPIPSILAVSLYLVLISIGEIINFPFISSISMDRAPVGSIGKYMSMNSMAFSLALIIAPIIGTNMITYFGYEVMFSSMVVVCGASILLVKYLSSRLIPLEPN